MTLPRILLISPSVFNEYSGGGVMLTNLFRGWPGDRIAMLHSDQFPADQSVCQRFYQLGPSEVRWMWPFSLVQHRLSHSFHASATGPAPGGTRTSRGRHAPSAPAWRRWGTRLLGEEFPRQVRITPPLRQWLLEFRPQLIYTLLGNLTYLQLVRQVAALLQLPVAVHMMDDWPAVLYRRGLFGAQLRRRMQRELRDLLSGAALRMGICEPMCRAYEARHGLPFLPFQNALDLPAWRAQARPDSRVHAPVRLVYTGSIVPSAQLNSLRDICDAVAALYRSGMPVELTIHSPGSMQPAYRAALERGPSVRLEPAADNDTVASVLTSADLLVLPVNFDTESVRYVRYSMPAKVPAYMISGTPVLVYGPREAASVQYALDEGWGFVVTQRSLTALTEAVQLLATDMHLRESLRQRAQHLAAENHDAAKVRPAFQQALAQASAYAPGPVVPDRTGPSLRVEGP